MAARLSGRCVITGAPVGALPGPHITQPRTSTIATAKALLDTRKSRKPAVEELWFPINDQQEGSGAVGLVQQLEYAEVMGHDEL